MSILSTSLRSALWLGVALALAAGVAACGGDDPCEVFCRRNTECNAGAPSGDECLALCDELSQDEDYAEALDEQVDCYEDESCDFIAAGGCAPDYS